MDTSQECERKVLFLFIIFMALISLSRSDSIMTVVEGEVVKLEFAYPCDSDKITIQRANGAPFYNSAQPEYLNLPDYDSNRFSVEVKNCSVQVEINPVMRGYTATYICIAYKDGGILELVRVRLNVDYPPVIISCLSSGKDTVGDWVPLQCKASVGTLAGEIHCYQDAKRLPPYNDLVQSGEILKQTIWVTAEYPIFCCSSIVNQPTDICECNDFAWDPSYIKSVLDPCPSSTPGQDTTMTDQLGENSTKPFFPNTITPLTSITTNEVCLSPWLWCFVLAITALLVLLAASLALVTLYLWCKIKSSNTNSTEKKDEHPETSEMRSKVREPQISRKDFVLVDIQNKPKIQPPLLTRNSFTAFQMTSRENNQRMHTGVYKRENIIIMSTETFKN